MPKLCRFVGMNLEQRLGESGAQAAHLPVLGVEGLVVARAGGEDQWVLLVEFRLAVGAHRRLLEVGQRLLPPGCQQRRPQLDAAGRCVESHLAVGALLALLELAIVELGVDPVELAGLVVGDAGLLDEVGEVLLKRFTWPEVLVPAAAELPVDLGSRLSTRPSARRPCWCFGCSTTPSAGPRAQGRSTAAARRRSLP